MLRPGLPAVSGPEAATAEMGVTSNGLPGRRWASPLSDPSLDQENCGPVGGTKVGCGLLGCSALTYIFHFPLILSCLISPRDITIPAIVRNRSGNSNCPHAKVSASMECQLALWEFLKKLKIGLPHDPAIPLLGV